MNLNHEHSEIFWQDDQIVYLPHEAVEVKVYCTWSEIVRFCGLWLDPAGEVMTEVRHPDEGFVIGETTFPGWTPDPDDLRNFMRANFGACVMNVESLHWKHPEVMSLIDEALRSGIKVEITNDDAQLIEALTPVYTVADFHRDVNKIFS